MATRCRCRQIKLYSKGSSKQRWCVLFLLFLSFEYSIIKFTSVAFRGVVVCDSWMKNTETIPLCRTSSGSWREGKLDPRDAPLFQHSSATQRLRDAQSKVGKVGVGGQNDLGMLDFAVWKGERGFCCFLFSYHTGMLRVKGWTRSLKVELWNIYPQKKIRLYNSSTNLTSSKADGSWQLHRKPTTFMVRRDYSECSFPVKK